MNLDPLLQRSFRTVNAREANQQIATVRHEQAVGGEDAMSYEVVAEPKWALEELAERVLPKIVYFLDCRGARFPLQPGGIFVSLFVGEQLHFIHAGDFVEALAKVRGLSADEAVERFGADAVLDEENERAPADGSGARELKLLPKP
jgi:hypothetical protein